MERRFGVQVGIERLRGLELGGRPAHRELREPVPLVIRALTPRATMHRTPVPLLLPLRDPPLCIRRGEELVDRLEPAALGELEVAG